MQRHPWIVLNFLKSAPKSASGRTRRAQIPSQHSMDCPGVPGFLQEEGIPHNFLIPKSPRSCLAWIFVSSFSGLILNPFLPGLVSFPLYLPNFCPSSSQESQSYSLLPQAQSIPSPSSALEVFHGIFSQFHPFPCKCFSPV